MAGDQNLELDRISKRYGDVVALDGLSLEVPAGDLFGFVGRNGAGKTTAMRIVVGVLTADAGEVRFGGTALTAEVRRQVGYMPDERGLYPKMRVAEQLAYRAEVSAVLRERADAALPVLFSSHELELVERLCDRVAIIERGRIVAHWTVEKLRAGAPERRWVDVPNAAARWGEGIVGAKLIERQGSRRLFELDLGANDQILLQAAMATGPVAEFHRVEPTLGEIFRAVLEEDAA
jgi:ABC-type uncharacterized transport system ATPase subunit